MAVDKNLFLHDLAIATSLKDEGPYIEEWLTYHLLAGVEHFYLYDHESVDNYNDIIKPYVDAGIVTTIKYPDNISSYAAFNVAVKQFKFFNRYLAFVDIDEFIFPKSNRPVVEVVDEILSHDPNAGGLAINWQIFGSNGQETADFSRGVLERFTRRAPTDFFYTETYKKTPINVGNAHIKNITNPRRINFIANYHAFNYFETFYSVNENLNPPLDWRSIPISADKIVINHYYTKSREEFIKRKSRRTAERLISISAIKERLFELCDRNDVFDDDILKYRAAREKNFVLEDENQRLNRVFTALAKNLSSFAQDVLLNDKMETALTCRALSTYLRKKFPDDDRLKTFEEASLEAILKSFSGMGFSDARLLIRELPDLLTLPYPITDELRLACLDIISELMYIMNTNHMWKDYVELDCLQRLLKNFRK